MLKRIIVDRHNIKHNKKEDQEDREVISVHYKGKAHKGFAVDINGPSRTVYSLHKPLKCGATVWIETTSEVVLHDNEGSEYFV